MAREKGLEPLAEWLRDHQAASAQELEAQAQAFLVQSEEEDKAVPDQAAALAGARDIMAEWVSDDATARSRMRNFYQEHAVLSSRIMTSKETTPEAARFRDYFEWSEPLHRIPSHRLLAIRRGETEGFTHAGHGRGGSHWSPQSVCYRAGAGGSTGEMV